MHLEPQRKHTPHAAPDFVEPESSLDLSLSCRERSDPSRHELLLKEWTGELTRDYGRPDLGLPESLREYGWWDRLKNRMLLSLAEQKLSTMGPDRIAGLSEAGSMDKLSHEVDRIRRHPLGFLYRGSLFEKLERSCRDSRQIGDRFRVIEDFHREFMADIDRYAKEYGAEFFPKDAVVRASCNAVAMKIFARLEGRDPGEREALNAIALLHPVTDDVIDRGGFEAISIPRITALLHGEEVQATSKFERLVFDFVKNIYREYPAAEHPLLDWSLRTLHQKQIESSAQRSGMSSDEMLDLTFVKGGLSTVAAGYISRGGLGEPEYEFFYKGGAIFQIMDDMADIAEDLRDGVKTVWTAELLEGRSLEEPFRRFLTLERAFEDRLATLAPAFAQGGRVSSIYKMGFGITAARAAMTLPEPYGEQLKNLLDPYLPASLWRLEAVFGKLGSIASKLEGGGPLLELAAAMLKKSPV
jgi:hypothetical protein